MFTDRPILAMMKYLKWNQPSCHKQLQNWAEYMKQLFLDAVKAGNAVQQCLRERKG